MALHDSGKAMISSFLEYAAVAVASLAIVAILALKTTIALVAGMLVFIGGRRLVR